MDDQLIDVFFRGDIVPGENVMGVRERLKKLFNADDQQLQQLFSGRPVVIRRNLDGPAAELYKESMLKAGALVELRPAKVAAESAEVTAPDATKVATQVTQGTASGGNSAPQPTSERAAADLAGGAHPGGQQPPGESGTPGDFSLAPVGADVLNEDERPRVMPVEVDISALAIEPMEGDLLKNDEKRHVEAVEIDVSHLSVEDLPPQ